MISTTAINKKQTRLFGSSGIRRIFGIELMDTILRLGLTCGRMYGNIIVGCDTRSSSNLLKHALVSGLLATGAEVQDAGVIPTPTLALAAKKFDLAMVITASHNPPEYNGIKLINPDGSGLNEDDQSKIEKAICNDNWRLAGWAKLKAASSYRGAVTEHISQIRQRISLERRLRVVVDTCCGAAHHITPYLLEKMGCDVIRVYCYPCGVPPRDAEPIEASLSDLRKAVLDSGADLGIAHDIDADRMMAIDDRGRFISGDKLLAIFAQALGFKDIVTTVDASMAIDEIGLNVSRTRVGDVFVSHELKKQEGSFGGEPSGTWVFPWMGLCPDGIYAAAQIAAIADCGNLSELADGIPQYPIIRGSIDSDGVSMTDLEGLLQGNKPISICKIDGIKLIYEDGWILVRRSGTEPKIRVTIEAKNEERLRDLYNHAMESIETCRT